MKKPILTTALLIGALGLSGCTGAGAPEASGIEVVTPSATPTAAASTAESAQPVDPDAVKASAVAAGRPEAAFDKDCQVWKLPEAGTDSQKWANELGQEWLDARGADCPDAITHPFYFVESFKPGNKGEMIVFIDNSLKKTAWKSADGKELPAVMWHLAAGVMIDVTNDHPELTKVTAVTEDGDWKISVNPQEVKKVRADGGVL